MKDKFPWYYRDEEFDFEPLWQNAVFAFDTNVLLNLYSLNTESKGMWLTLLRRMKEEDRLFMPYQVAYEYHLGIAGRLDRARKSALRSSQTTSHKSIELLTIENLLKDSPVLQSDVSDNLSNTRADFQKKLDKAISDINEQLARELTQQVDKWKVQFEMDWKDTKHSLQEIFADALIKVPSAPTIRARCLEAQTRFEAKIPPGYQDYLRKKDNPKMGNPFGDALIWFELKEFCVTEQRPLIYITNDSDWSHKVDNDVFPRPELQNEMLVETGCAFSLSTPTMFAKWGGAEKSIPEVERVQEAQRDPVLLNPATQVIVHPCEDGRVLTIRFVSEKTNAAWNALNDREREHLLERLDENSLEPAVTYTIAIQTEDRSAMITVSFRRVGPHVFDVQHVWYEF